MVFLGRAVKRSERRTMRARVDDGALVPDGGEMLKDDDGFVVKREEGGVAFIA